MIGITENPYFILEFNFFVGQVYAYDRCWIFGDNFASSSFEQYFNNRKATDFNSYIKSHFDVSGFFNNFMCENPSIMGRLANLLACAVSRFIERKQLPLPKLLVLVPDDDLVKTLADYQRGLATGYGKIINYVMTEFDRGIATYKENLPAKCLKLDYPQMLWIQAPHHINFGNNVQREQYNKCLEEMCKLHSNTHTLALKKIWDPQDTALYLSSGRFSSEGYKLYWEAVDKTVRYFDSIVLKKCKKRKAQRQNAPHTFGQKDQFRWKNL